MPSRDSEDKVTSKNSAGNGYIHDVIGNKEDTTAGDSVVALNKINKAAIDASQLDVTAIKAVTDVIPDAGAMTSIAQDATVAKEATLGTPIGADLSTDIAAIQTDVTAIKAVTAILPDAGALTSIAQEATVTTLDAKVSGTIASASFDYLDAGAKQTIVEVVNTAKKLVKGIFVDCNTLIQNGTLGFETKIDGTNYREVAKAAFTVATDDSIMLPVNIITDKDFKFTWTEGGEEGADRALPYKISYMSLA